MNNIELEALRRLLFFSAPEAAAMISGTSERAWKHWEAGARPVPQDVAARVRELVHWRRNAYNAALATILEQRERLGDSDTLERARLVWYGRMQDWTGEPVLWRPHQSVCAALADFDYIELVPFDSANYAAWLGSRKDSESMRGAWAAKVE